MAGKRRRRAGQASPLSPFTPKIIALLGRNLPSALRTRCIELRMLPKRKDEKVEDFNHLDDVEFATLRRKFLSVGRPIIMRRCMLRCKTLRLLFRRASITATAPIEYLL